jgi:hypothetical protein
MIGRRHFLQLAAAGALSCIATARVGAHTAVKRPIRRLVFVPCRDRQGLDAIGLKSQWLAALQRGAASSHRRLPPSIDVNFPYYGDVLYKYVSAADVPPTSDIQARGDANLDYKFPDFEANIADQLRKDTGISEAALDAQYRNDPETQGSQNWEWVQALARVLDKYDGKTTSNFIEQYLRNVYIYSYRGGVRNQINAIVSASLTQAPSVVVGHSLGSVVAHSVLSADKHSLHVPVYVTIGRPLAIGPVRQFAPVGLPQPPVSSRSNAFDPRNVVALYPVDRSNFPVNPAITNCANVNNHPDNRLGINGYLDDPTVAKWILDVLG